MTTAAPEIRTYCKTCYQNDCICAPSMPAPSWYSPEEKAMEIDAPGSDPLPTHLEPETRTEYAIAQTDALRRYIAWMHFRYNLPNNMNIGRFELDHAPGVNSLQVKLDKAGNLKLTIDPKGMGS